MRRTAGRGWPRCRKKMMLVGRGYEVFRCAAIAGVGDDAKDDAYFTSSGAVDGDAAHAGPGCAQQLWSDGGYGGTDAESCADDLCVWEFGGVAGWGKCWRKEGAVAGKWGEAGDGEGRVECATSRD